ncbi:MAG: hypothetical protein ACYTGQ_05075 [Planctomycetota bacterium]
MQAKTLPISLLLTITAGVMVVAAVVTPLSIPAPPDPVTGSIAMETPASGVDTTVSLQDFAPLYNRRYQSWNRPANSTAPTVRTDNSIENSHGIVYQGSIIEFNNQNLTLQREGPDPNPFANSITTPDTNSTETKDPAAGRTVLGRANR